MPPIPIHKDAPIKPTDGTTQTTDLPPTRTIPLPNTATTTSTVDGPPPPQPGARPIPPTVSPNAPSSTYTPAAPQPGATPTVGGGYTATHTTLETRLSAPPPQATIPPPSDSQLAGRSTTTSTTASKPAPTTLNLGPGASPYQGEHSGGAAVPTGASGEGRKSLEHPPGYVQASDNQPYGGGLLQGGQGGGSGGGGGGGGVGGAAWNMLNRAGEALKKGEEAAWKAMRNN